MNRLATNAVGVEENMKYLPLAATLLCFVPANVSAQTLADQLRQQVQSGSSGEVRRSPERQTKPKNERRQRPAHKDSNPDQKSASRSVTGAANAAAAAASAAAVAASAAAKQGAMTQEAVRQADEAARANAARAAAAAKENAASTRTLATKIEASAMAQAALLENTNRQIGDLSAQIAMLTKVLDAQKARSPASTPTDTATRDQTIAALEKKIADLKNEVSEKEASINGYMTSIRPEDRDRYITARKASLSYPKVPYYIPGTPEIGEFWVEPIVTNGGELNFNFRFIDPTSENKTTRSVISMTPEQIGLVQSALVKLGRMSEIAHEHRIRENYSKRVVCFPIEQCPPERSKGVLGKYSSEVQFQTYEDGSTAGRIVQNKGQFQEGFNMSIDSSLMLQAYLEYVAKEALIEYGTGIRTQEDLDRLFQ